jgi:subtilisin family serine protease
MTRRRLVLGVLASVAAGAIISLAAGGGVAAEGSTNLRAATVHPTLFDQLQANPTGGIDAVVTAWNRSDLDAIQAVAGGTKLKVLPMVLTRSLTAAKLDALRQLASVRSVYPNERFELYMEDTTWITKARYVWATSNGPGGLDGFGYKGAGIHLAVIDTGADGQHEDMDNLVEFCEAQEAATADGESVRCSPWNPAFNTLPVGTGTNPRIDCNATTLCDDEGHGSHVSGTVLGAGHASGGTLNNHSTIGMSPHAKLHAYSANLNAVLFSFQTLAAYDDMTNKREANLDYNVVAVNNSWGGGGGSNYDSSNPTNVAIKRAYDAGILSVFAAGNSGPEYNTLSAQCVNPYVVCVAASTKPDQKVMFSSVGRPSQPTDTNRDGVINGDDVQPDNHDRNLGQKLELGLYRPALSAPGVNINSISANSPGCREDDLITEVPDEPATSGCYEQLNGTSMATPHVTGAVGLIAQAFRAAHGRLPTPAETTEILERSANRSKLPAWETEEQGAGRLDVHEAVKLARSDAAVGLRPASRARPNLGYPTPPYQPNAYPKGPDDPSTFVEHGCTGFESWTSGDIETPAPGGPSVATYGRHVFTVAPKTDRLRIHLRWGIADEPQHPEHALSNLYARLWRPGVDPSSDTNPAGQTRTFPDQESIGLTDTNAILNNERFLEVRSPEAGNWELRIYHRVGGAPSLCDPDSQGESVPTGFNYTLYVERPLVTHQPSVIIDQPTDPSPSGRWVDLRGRASYPPPDNPDPKAQTPGRSWEGVTNWEVPGSSRTGDVGDEEPGPDDPRKVLYMHGNTAEGCSGNGPADVPPPCGGPFLLEKLPAGAAATWSSGVQNAVLEGASDRTIHDPNWSWCLTAGPGCPTTGGGSNIPAGPQTVGGPMTLVWWAACNLCSEDVGISADWVIRVWADGVLKFEQRITATPADPGVPSKLVRTVTLPTFSAGQRIVVHIDPVYVDSQTVALIHYDSEGPCPAATTGPCDSRVHMPVGGSGGGGSTAPATPENVRVTDLPANAPYPTGVSQVQALRVAWDPVQGASYRVYRSTDPLTRGLLRYSGPGQSCPNDPDGPGPELGFSPEAPAPEPDDAPPGHDRAGLCFTDTMGLELRRAYYYRVVAVQSNTESANSEVAYGIPTRYDRQVKLKVDRLYGPQHWEYALVSPSPNPLLDSAGTQWRFLWDTLELETGAHKVFARSFTQGIGSQKAERTFTEDDPPPPPPPPDGGCPDDDDGDGDDDADDGDSDDDGDDSDDDCEDDEDDEEEDDD